MELVFKAKKVAFRENDPRGFYKGVGFLILAWEFSCEMKTGFHDKSSKTYPILRRG